VLEFSKFEQLRGRVPSQYSILKLCWKSQLPLGSLLERGIAPTLARTEIDYLAPARLSDVIEARMWMEEAGRARFVLGAEFTSRASGQVTARAKQIGVFVSVESGRPVPLPAEYRT
jgi:acyl-CoA thioester hydrolase